MGKNKEELLAMAKENSETKKGIVWVYMFFLFISVVLFNALILILSYQPVHCLLNEISLINYIVSSTFVLY